MYFAPGSHGMGAWLGIESLSVGGARGAGRAGSGSEAQAQVLGAPTSPNRRTGTKKVQVQAQVPLYPGPGALGGLGP